MTSYLARVEESGDYFNLRPVLKIQTDGSLDKVDTKLFEPDEASKPRGTLTITARYGRYENTPYIQDQKYCIFSISDYDLTHLEIGDYGYKIRARDFVEVRREPVDSYSICEVIKLPAQYKLTDAKTWARVALPVSTPPLSKNVYLTDETHIAGPYTWEALSDEQYKFTPLQQDDDLYYTNYYNKSDCNIHDFPATWDSFSYRKRSVLWIMDLPEKVGSIDHMDNETLKEFFKNELSKRTLNAENQDVKTLINALPSEVLSEERKSRILLLAMNKDFVSQTINEITQTVMKDSNNKEQLVSAILGNTDYANKLYPELKEHKVYQAKVKSLEEEIGLKEDKVAELDQLIITKTSELDNIGAEQVSSDEVDRLNAENQTLKDELEKYQELEKLGENCESKQRELSELEIRLDIKDKDLKKKEKELDEVYEAFKSKVDSAYSDIAFDGALSSMLLREAAKFEQEELAAKMSGSVVHLEDVESISPIETPKDLVDYLYNKLTVDAKRNISKNDVANIVICVSQGFLTVFAGEPGCGKTSLVSLLAQILGLSNSRHPRYQEIAVEKGWSSRRDLIGYYNPLTKGIEAANKGMFTALSTLNAESVEGSSVFPYWILLDEANLSQMEHYWADFMSLCDFDKVSNRQISLHEDYVFKINPTLRFLATINLDHTTEVLSPRLIDRAWIIKLHAANLEEINFMDAELKDEYPLVRYSIFDQLCSKDYLNSEKIDKSVLDKLNTIRTIFSNEVGINLSPRVIRMITRYCLASDGLIDTSETSYAALDYAVAQKVLPMIDGYGEKYQSLVDKLMVACSSTSMPICFNLLSKIQKKGKDNMHYYQFFAR